MTSAERISASKRKKAADPGQQKKTGAAKPTYVSTDSPKKKMKEEMEVREAKDKPSKGSGKKDACYHKVKSRYSVWPSAYASGALVKCRKVGADNWGTKSEEIEEQRYCPLCDKRETRSECSYGEKAWDKVSVKDEEYSMARSELKTIVNAVKRLQTKVGRGEGDLEAWVQSKITKAADYIDTAADYVNSGEMEEQKLVDKIVDEMKCWSGYKKKGTQKLFGKTYNRCVKAENVTIEDMDGNTFAEVIDLIKPEPIKGFKSQVDEATRLQAQTGNVVAVTLLWRGKYYSLKMFFPQIKTPSRQEINDELQKVYPGSKVIHHTVSEFTSGEPIIQAFGPQGGSSAKPGPSRAYVKPYSEQVEFDEDWQKVNRQDKTAGLSKSAVAAYRRENPGSNLQTAVTEKNPKGKRANRRASFCRRMKGMKSKLTSAKTARDPDSNINKALRRWNCN
jgi:ribosomal protein S24E